MSVTIHPTAIVEDGAELGEGTRVWHHAHIRAGAQIGAGVTIGKNVFVDAGVRIGDRSKVQNNVSVYAGVTVEEDVFLGPACVLTNDRIPRANTSSWEIVPTLIRKGASVGANATIVCGVELGEGCMVAAGALVNSDVPPFGLVVGVPSRVISWVCACGAQRFPLEPKPALETLRCHGDHNNERAS